MNYLKTALSAILVISPFSFLGAEGIENDPSYFTISETVVTMHESEDAGETANLVMPDRKVAPVAAAGAIVNGGAAAWNIVNGGQASSHLSHTYASALPGWGDWHNITGWHGPKKVVYEMKSKNLYGMTVLDIQYEVSFFYGGKDQNGKGQYITNFTAKATRFAIKWGFKYYMDIRISDPMNVGTPENPLAYMQADVNWSFSSPIKTNRGFQTYAVRGDGMFRDISPDTSKMAEELALPEAPEKISVEWN
ncbi:MAG: hypothetical protein FD189_1152 [Elusimicrobia bacterium]|nr:MAG: hypothetical protein FD154_859 [Elusimicrobiota bacterium]KAF0156108.1 MAG: hypothetical protein FD189_1152 [Elusimicrobiota bacterium]